jgi:muramoyltetrapeptide carboxypeptidase LdcA involved in peptidoglycan recycling
MIPAGFQPNGQTEAYQWFELNRPAMAKKIKKTLCGFSDCTCGVVRM